MGNEDIEKAKKALSKISKEHEKLHELAMQKRKVEEKEKSNEDSIEKKLFAPLPAGTIDEVRSKVHAPEPIALKTSEVGLEQSVSSVPLPVRDEEENKDSPYKQTKAAYETSNQSIQSNNRIYETNGVEITSRNIGVIRPEAVARTKEMESQFTRVQTFAGPEPMRTPIQQDVSAYVETKRLDHEQFSKEKTTEVKKWYEVKG